LFHNYNVFGSFIIHILYTVCAKIKKNNSGAQKLNISGAQFRVTSTLITSLTVAWRQSVLRLPLFEFGVNRGPRAFLFSVSKFNLSARELFSLILAHPVYKM